MYICRAKAILLAMLEHDHECPKDLTADETAWLKLHGVVDGEFLQDRAIMQGAWDRLYRKPYTCCAYESLLHVKAAGLQVMSPGFVCDGRLPKRVVKLLRRRYLTQKQLDLLEQYNILWEEGTLVCS